MKKLRTIFVVVAVIATLILVTSSAKANGGCDQQCVEKAAAGQMSQTELKTTGYGNVVRALTKANEGDIGVSLWQVGLWGSNPAGNVNAIFGTNVPSNCVGFFLQDDGSVLAYGLDMGDVLHTYVCYPNKPCTEQK